MAAEADAGAAGSRSGREERAMISNAEAEALLAGMLYQGSVRTMGSCRELAGRMIAALRDAGWAGADTGQSVMVAEGIDAQARAFLRTIDAFVFPEHCDHQTLDLSAFGVWGMMRKVAALRMGDMSSLDAARLLSRLTVICPGRVQSRRTRGGKVFMIQPPGWEVNQKAARGK
jgi:hypothetical protein